MPLKKMWTKSATIVPINSFGLFSVRTNRIKNEPAAPDGDHPAGSSCHPQLALGPLQLLP